MRVQFGLVVLAMMLIVVFGATGVAGQSSIGTLKVDRLICPRQVAPSTNFQVTVDVEYGLFGVNPSAVIRSAIYTGPLNSSTPIWQSDAANVSYVGEELWNTTLTSPSSEGYLNLTAYVFYQQDGVWKVSSNSSGGSSFAQASIKIGRISSLDVYIGAPSVTITINGSTLTTSTSGDVTTSVPLNSITNVNVPPSIDFQNSTRGVFSNWDDGNKQSQRKVTINGDTRLVANYTLQYLLKINAPSSSESWYGKNTIVTLTANTTTPMNWPLNALGVQGEFTGWSGDVQSSATQVNVTMDSPKTVDANYSFDYKLLAVPILLMVGGIVLVLSIVLYLKQRKTATEIPEPAPETTEETSLICPKCGNQIEKEWTHCIKCGTKLKQTSSNEA